MSRKLDKVKLDKVKLDNVKRGNVKRGNAGFLNFRISGRLIGGFGAVLAVLAIAIVTTPWKVGGIDGADR